SLWFRLGWIGVDQFFVISGFVIALSAMSLWTRDPSTYVARYCGRRLLRIVPLHYSTCLVWIVFVTPAILFQDRFWFHALTHLTFTHNFSPETIGSVNGPNWSLGVEMQFYLLILLAAPLLCRVHPISVLVTCIGVAWTWRAFQ